MTMEQFYHLVPEVLAVWMRDRKSSCLQQMTELADDYMLSCKGMGSEGTTVIERPAENTSKETGRQVSDGCTVSASGSVPGQRATTNVQGDKRCYQCG